MYTPTHFEEARLHVLHDFMRRHPLASVVAQAAGRLDANHIPLILDAAEGPFGRLRGHIARANAMWRDIEGGAEALVLFHGPDSYVSPNYYPSKREHGKVVPTWNYSVVHARGKIAWRHDPQWLRSLVSELTQLHETGQAEPWRMADAPDDYIEQMIKGIVGFEISIDELKGKMKLSQNRTDADRAGVKSELVARGDPGSIEMAALMGGQGNESAS